jgi:nicotinate-nucleotide adenylyltransferase
MRGASLSCSSDRIDRLPPHAPGLRIGLFGGSFNPPHVAHRAVCLYAMKRLGLDRVWWLVTPGNPLKDVSGLPPLCERMTAAGRLAQHPQIDVTGIEAAIGTSYSYETILWLKRRCPGVRFVWIMGADNLKSFHRWRNWRGIFAALPIAVVDRPDGALAATATRAFQAFSQERLPENQAQILAISPPPAWIYLHGLKSPLSSTTLRKGRALARGDTNS